MALPSLPPPSVKRRRRQPSQRDVAAVPTTIDSMLQTPRIAVTTDDNAAPVAAAPRARRRRRRRSGGGVVAKGAMVVFLAGGVGTAVMAFSAVCSAPPRQRPHRELISTNSQQQPAPPPIMVPSPPLVGVNSPHARQFLEGIIAGQEAAEAEAVAAQGIRRRRRLQQQQQQHLGNNTAILGLTDYWGGMEGAGGGAIRLKEEPSLSVAPAAVPARQRPAPLPREYEEEEEEEEYTGPPRAVVRTAAVPAKKPKPKYGYRRSSNKRAQAIHDSCAELCQTKLLTRAEEYELGTKIQTLMGHVGTRQELAAGLGRAPTFSEWAESCRMTVVELEESLKVCGAAKKTMVEANMRMVISIARKYQHLGVPLTDLIQEGSLGLVRAVEKFDPERGFKLSTYSAWWIQQAIFKGIANQSRTVRLPMHVHNLLGRVRRAKNELGTGQGYLPTDHQIARHLDMPVTRLRRYLELTKESVSFEMPIDPSTSLQSGKERVLRDTLVAKERDHPEREGDSVLFRARLREVVGELSEDEKIVLSHRFGLEDGKRKSLRQIAEMVRTSQNYVRRVEGTAMRKLRAPEQQRRLRDFSNFSSSSGGLSSLSPRRSSIPAASTATSWEELLAAAAAASSSNQNRNRGRGGRRARRGVAGRRSAVSSR
ncbi:unnamed protein product [Ectocarpus sp. 13 AM-2016]